MARRVAIARWRARWFALSPLGRSIPLVLVIKLAALFLLWWAFFSHPMPQWQAVDAPRFDSRLAPSPEQPAHANR